MAQMLFMTLLIISSDVCFLLGDVYSLLCSIEFELNKQRNAGMVRNTMLAQFDARRFSVSCSFSQLACVPSLCGCDEFEPASSTCISRVMCSSFPATTMLFTCNSVSHIKTFVILPLESFITTTGIDTMVVVLTSSVSGQPISTRFYSCKLLLHNKVAYFSPNCMILFSDPGCITISQYILLDPILMFYIMLSAFCLTKYHTYANV